MVWTMRGTSLAGSRERNSETSREVCGATSILTASDVLLNQYRFVKCSIAGNAEDFMAYGFWYRSR